ncbi:hypothetical protein Pst134EA_022737 [Puccinia striiformis f. sp. tritici]|uniref:hypothetical protein n=1 Tax=Puccinia striiformis f. sp. tritici TaxID=168172 RepID=UPI0020087EFE|nr:hypothetical protein Pst134EA_022737 [Puccinia striiformis f. sp. tritici]KAH9455263.1 hypothetical protein Pst134EA_022737 [Puccinia striiformis f. sp. tritici]
MVDYLYVSSADGNEGAQWAHPNNGFQPSESPGPSSWTYTSQTMRDSPAIYPPSTFYDPDSDLTEVLRHEESENLQSHSRKGQLSHSRSFPDLHQPQTQVDLSSFRAASVSLELTQPGEFNPYSFESHLNQSSSLFPPSNASAHQFYSQDSYNQYQGHQHGSSNGLQPTLAGLSNFRSRSDSEGSGSWAGINTPITPSDMNVNNSGYKAELGAHGSSGFSHNNNNNNSSRLNTSDFSAHPYPSSAPADSGFLNSRFLASSPLAPSDSADLHPHSAQHAYAMNGFPAPPVLHNVRSGSTGRRPQIDSGNDTTITLGHHLHHEHRSVSPNTQSQALQPMSAGPAYSRSLSIESNVMSRHRSTSATSAEFSDHFHEWDSHPHPASQPMSAPIGHQFSNLHLDTPDHMLASFLPPKNTIPRAEREALLTPFIRLYLSSTNRFLLGERTVLVLSGKVAQKSYGAEKRFLCPPPSALLLGCSWWAAADADPRRPMPSSNRLALHPPTTVISMSGEHSIPTEAYSEWMSMSGHVVGDQASLDDVVIAGRCVGKQLHISEVDEKTKKVEALVRVIAPGFGPPEARHIGTFPSKPIKVISKPSKKRQSIKNLDLCIHHGTTIALFNRLRSQTVSTKYLCVSGPSASFPAGDWRAMSGMEDKPFAPGEDATCFVARTSAWDPFIIYLVDPSKPATVADNVAPAYPPPPGYPRAPSNALPVSPNAGPIPIYYNQPVVLQCLSTAVVSPVMIIRKVDKGSTAIGGASLEGNASSGQRDMPVAPGEVLGDPVSQLHKIALEVMTDPQSAYMAPITSPYAGFPGSGSFLACLGENVGVHRAESGRQAVPPLMTPPPSASSAKSFGGSHSDALAEANYLSSNHNHSMHSSGTSRARSNTPSGALELDLGTSEGGKVKRPRKVSNTLLHGRAPSKNRKRGGSMSSCGHDEHGSESECNHSNSLFPHASKVWTIECGEPAVWTIVGCDVERHTFWIPPVLIHGKPSSPVPPGAVSDVFTTPIPATPIGYDTSTPIPVITKYLPPNPAASDPQELKMIIIYGANLSPHLHVWFGDIPSPHVEHKCAEVMMAQPPHHPMNGQSPTARQIILVSDDGIVFPSKVYFTSF